MQVVDCAADLRRVRSLNAAVLPVAYRDAFYRDLLALPPPSRLALQCEEAGRVEGAILCSAEGGGCGVEATLLSLAVAPGSRRRGVGGRLVAAALEWAARAGARELRVHVQEDNEGARAFYAALGFAEVRLLRGYYRRVEFGSANAVLLSVAVPRSPVA
eukprot:m51a1_g6915 putative n-alpha-acetyltransferase 50 isoform x1 (159) ;mRNA; r:130446-131010